MESDNTFAYNTVCDVPCPRCLQEVYCLYGVLWQTDGHKCTESVLVLYYRHELTLYGQNIKASSSNFILKQPVCPPMRHMYPLFFSKHRTHLGFTAIYNVLIEVKVWVELSFQNYFVLDRCWLNRLSMVRFVSYVLWASIWYLNRRGSLPARLCYFQFKSE